MFTENVQAIAFRDVQVVYIIGKKDRRGSATGKDSRFRQNGTRKRALRVFHLGVGLGVLVT